MNPASGSISFKFDKYDINMTFLYYNPEINKDTADNAIIYTLKNKGKE